MRYWKKRILSNENNINGNTKYIRELQEAVYRINKILDEIIKKGGIGKEIETIKNEVDLELMMMKMREP